MNILLAQIDNFDLWSAAMDGSFGFQRETSRVEAGACEARPVVVTVEPEWSLSAGQVALLVAVIIGFCELVGNFL